MREIRTHARTHVRTHTRTHTHIHNTKTNSIKQESNKPKTLFFHYFLSNSVCSFVYTFIHFYLKIAVRKLNVAD